MTQVPHRCVSMVQSMLETSPEMHEEWLASQPRSASQFSQEFQGIERIREQENPDILRRGLGLTYGLQRSSQLPETGSPSPPPPHSLISGRTQLEPREMTSGVRGPGWVTQMKQVLAMRSRQDFLGLRFTTHRDNATYPGRAVCGPREQENVEEP